MTKEQAQIEIDRLEDQLKKLKSIIPELAYTNLEKSIKLIVDETKCLHQIKY